MGLVGAMVRVLTSDDDFDGVYRRMSRPGEDEGEHEHQQDHFFSQETVTYQE